MPKQRTTDDDYSDCLNDLQTALDDETRPNDARILARAFLSYWEGEPTKLSCFPSLSYENRVLHFRLCHLGESENSDVKELDELAERCRQIAT